MIAVEFQQSGVHLTLDYQLKSEYDHKPFAPAASLLRSKTAGAKKGKILC